MTVQAGRAGPEWGGKMAAHIDRFDSGVACIYGEHDCLGEIAELLRISTVRNDIGFALIVFSKAASDAESIAAFMKLHAPTLQYAACSTAGEITPEGVTQGSIQFILFPSEHFTIRGIRLSSPAERSIEEIATEVMAFRSAFHQLHGSHRNMFAISLMDGMSYTEEATTASIHWGLDDLQLVGGSAGDDLDFKKASLVLNGEVFERNSILLLVSSALPVHIFKTDNFVPTDMKLVVTKSDPDRRIVHEFNAAPAATVYADIIGTDPATLNPQSFASHPLVMKVGGEYYCRSIQKVNDDNSLSFFCAIDDGIVLTVAEPTGMARSTEQCFSDVTDRVGKIDFILGFDCVLRRIDARNRQVTHKISKLYKEHRVVGFNTYGEQYRSLHLNQTLTGVAFGSIAEEPGSILRGKAGE
jgi:hypothetical protein